jgi:hypothetical protein
MCLFRVVLLLLLFNLFICICSNIFTGFYVLFLWGGYFSINCLNQPGLTCVEINILLVKKKKKKKKKKTETG